MPKQQKQKKQKQKHNANTNSNISSPYKPIHNINDSNIHHDNAEQYLQTNAIALKLLATVVSFALGETIDNINKTYDHDTASNDEINKLISFLDRAE